MERLYAELSEYYVFDKLKYTLEEFFGDIKTFKDQFKQVGLVRKVLMEICPSSWVPPIKLLFNQAYDSMLKERESEAKLARAREAREKADKERY